MSQARVHWTVAGSLAALAFPLCATPAAAAPRTGELTVAQQDRQAQHAQQIRPAEPLGGTECAAGDLERLRYSTRAGRAGMTAAGGPQSSATPLTHVWLALDTPPAGSARPDPADPADGIRARAGGGPGECALVVTLAAYTRAAQAAGSTAATLLAAHTVVLTSARPTAELSVPVADPGCFGDTELSAQQGLVGQRQPAAPDQAAAPEAVQVARWSGGDHACDVAGTVATAPPGVSSNGVLSAGVRDLAPAGARADRLARTGPGASPLGEAAVAIALCVLGGVTLFRRRAQRAAETQSSL